MKLENQVTNLELSRKLKELGVKQDSYFDWFKLKENNDYSLVEYWQIDYEIRFDTISAFTVAELGELLPNSIQLKNQEPFDNYSISIHKFNRVSDDMKVINNFIVNYYTESDENSWLRIRLTPNIYDPNLANAMAKMLIYLLENGMIKNE